MREPAKIICDGCRSTVAVRNCLLWRTCIDYITLPRHLEPDWDGTEVRDELHYCQNCWNEILMDVRRTKIGKSSDC